jgi:curli biogenesis system outer membrane secretion channel CsgG
VPLAHGIVFVPRKSHLVLARDLPIDCQARSGLDCVQRDAYEFEPKEAMLRKIDSSVLLNAILKCAVCVFLWAGIVSLQAAQLSIAIITEDEKAEPAADLLLAELSKSGDLKLLERQELKRIISEQALSIVSSKDLVTAGKLAGADALLFLDHYANKKEGAGAATEFLGMRLILVGPGVLLHTADFAWPPKDLVEWSKPTVTKLGRFLDRARVPEDAAWKLSFLSFRSPTDSRESRLLDQELSALLLKRLAAQTNIFVLERQKLGATLLERELNSELSPFWRGSYLIDGIVNKLGYSADSVSLEARIVPPNGGATNIVSLKGERANLPKLIDQLASDLMRLARKAPAKGWDPSAEAARYFEEATWALQWNLLAEAQAAADAAWALGKKDEATAITRVQAYARAADVPRRASFPEAPQRETLRNAIIALSIVLEWTPRIRAESGSQEWLSASLYALRTASDLLRRYYFIIEARAGVEAELAELRALCRDTASWLNSVPSLRAPFFLESRYGGDRLTWDRLETAFKGENLYKTMAEYGALWQEKIEDALPMHRVLITAPSFSYIRKAYFTSVFHEAPLAGWNWQERRRAYPLWKEFLAALERSTNVVTKVEAKILRSAMIAPDGKLFTHIRDTLAFISANADELGKHPAPLLYEWHMHALLQKSSDRVTAEKEKLRKEVAQVRESVFVPLHALQWKNTTTRLGLPPPEPSLQTRPVVVNTEAPVIVLPPIRTNLLTIGVFHSLPPTVLARSNVYGLQMYSCLVENDSVWVRILYNSEFWSNTYEGGGVQRSSFKTDGSLLAQYSPTGGLTRVIRQPRARFPVPEFLTRDRGLAPDFQFWRGELFAAGGAQLQKYVAKAEDWVSLPIPLAREAQLHLFNDRLYAITPESLLEIEPGGASAKTLVSTRRQPALTPLDALPNFASAVLFGGGKGFRAWVPPALYEYDGATFSLLHSFKPPGEISADRSHFFYLETEPYNRPNAAQLLRADSRNPETLFFQMVGPTAEHRKRVPKSRWADLDCFTFVAETAVHFGDDLLIEGTPNPIPGSQNSIHPALSLKPYLIVLRKNEPAVVLDVRPAEGVPLPNTSWDESPVRPFAIVAKNYLVFGNNQQAGLWFLPLADLNRAVGTAKGTEILGGQQ